MHQVHLYQDFVIFRLNLYIWLDTWNISLNVLKLLHCTFITQHNFSQSSCLLLICFHSAFLVCFQSASSLLPLLLICFHYASGLLPVCFPSASSVLPVCFQSAPICFQSASSLLPVTFQSPSSHLPVCFQSVNSIPFFLQKPRQGLSSSLHWLLRICKNKGIMLGELCVWI